MRAGVDVPLQPCREASRKWSVCRAARGRSSRRRVSCPTLRCGAGRGSGRRARPCARGRGSKVPAEYADKLENILFALDTALVVDALDLPGFRLHLLKGDLKGYWSITVRANWRVVFRFENGQALDVDLVDYH